MTRPRGAASRPPTAAVQRRPTSWSEANITQSAFSRPMTTRHRGPSRRHTSAVPRASACAYRPRGVRPMNMIMDPSLPACGPRPSLGYTTPPPTRARARVSAPHLPTSQACPRKGLRHITRRDEGRVAGHPAAAAHTAGHVRQETGREAPPRDTLRLVVLRLLLQSRASCPAPGVGRSYQQPGRSYCRGSHGRSPQQTPPQACDDAVTLRLEPIRSPLHGGAVGRTGTRVCVMVTQSGNVVFCGVHECRVFCFRFQKFGQEPVNDFGIG
jgi:hypothetical protein